MIQYLKNNEIDIKKYDTCIELSTNSRIYAFSWYLNIVADNWDVLVLNDYEAVMPLPWRRKYFIKYIYPPAWTQQLGIFSSTHISEKLVLDFIKAIPKKFKKITIQFNSENKFKHKNVTERVNYVLPLNKSYGEIYKGFNNNRKRDLKKAIKSKFEIVKNINKNDFFNFYLKAEKNYKLNSNQLLKLKSLLDFNDKNIQVWGIYHDKNLIAGLLWLKDDNRITNLLPVASKSSKDLGLPTSFLNEIIYQFSGSNLIIDFEGSIIKGIADFYKSFGIEKENYFLYQKSFNVL
ncbi:hypothetical protein BX611_2087 [Lutibacter oceani]|uniref:Acetyltransferase (GNAT) family protein n=1 Tax=Lutibacter oceani TaxID=1853311 RepID=A0A3D9RUT4_9FLAO|nr:hypothetical protein [Lutibacter oceani]REE80445.1 hypothetical protein BX611_2087 [Lutibacter oceani]